MPMLLQDTRGELWFRPNPKVALFELQRLITQRALRTTLRLGVRDATHPTKGYTPGQTVTLRIYDSQGEQQHVTRVAVTAVTVRRLNELTPQDLVGCEPTLRTWRDAQVMLSSFERHGVPPDAPVTVVSFTYPEQQPTEQIS